MQKIKKLSQSFEIWAPEKDRKYLTDGSYELNNMEISGGALILEDADNKPAFKNAKILSLAKEYVEDSVLEYASKIKDSEIVNGEDMNNKAGENKPGVRDGLGPYKDSAQPNKDGVRKRAGEPCPVDVKERPLTQKELLDDEENLETQEASITCSHCQSVLNPANVMRVKDYIKCPTCNSLLNEVGEEKYPPQNINFKMSCLNCNNSSWIVTKESEEGATIECTSCDSKYDIIYKTSSIPVGKMRVLNSSRVNCPQCSTAIATIFANGVLQTLHCTSCGLDFTYKAERKSKQRFISKIKRIDKVNLEKSEEEVVGMKIPKEVEARVITSAEAKSEEAEVVKEEVEAKVVEEVTVVQPKADASSKENDDSDSEEEVTEVVEEPKAEVEAEVVEEPKAEVEAEVEVEEEPKAKVEEEAEVEEVDDVQKELKELRSLLKMSASRTVATKKALNLATVELAEYKEIVTAKRTKTANKLVALKNSKKELELAFDEKVDFYKNNAKQINERRDTLGETYSTELSDEELLNDDKFEIASLRKERDELKLASLNEDGDGIEEVTLETATKDAEFYAKKRAEIDAEAKKYLTKE